MTPLSAITSTYNIISGEDIDNCRICLGKIMKGLTKYYSMLPVVRNGSGKESYVLTKRKFNTKNCRI